MKFVFGASLLLAAGTAFALDIAKNEIGDAHYIPFYDIRDGKSTQFEIANRWSSPKIVRVVVTEALDGRSVLEFNVYLDGNDTFAAALSASAQGAVLSTVDASCTRGLRAGGTPLALSSADQASSGHRPAQMQMGAIEVFEVGSWNPAQANGQSTRSHSWFCQQVEQNFAGKWHTDPNADVYGPEGTLAVTSQIIDPRTGSNYSPMPVAIREFSYTARHTDPSQTDAIRLYKPQPEPGATKFEVAGKYRFPLSRPQDAASMLFINNFAELPIAKGGPTEARTEFVTSFPTRRAYLPRDLGGIAAGAAQAPFDMPQVPDAEPQCTRADWFAHPADSSGAIRLTANPQCDTVSTQSTDELENRPMPGAFSGKVSIEYDGMYIGHMPAEIAGTIFPDFVEGLPAVTRAIRTFHTPHPVEGSHTFVIVDPAWTAGDYLHRGE